MDVKIIFLNGELKDKVYIDQHEGFTFKRKVYMMCKF